MLKNYLNYAGSKDRYYPLIREFLEKAVKGMDSPQLIDMFCGSGVVSYNSMDMFDSIGAFDGCLELIRLHTNIYMNDDFVTRVKEIIKAYGLSKDNKEGFLKLREKYNNDVIAGNKTDSAELYCLITHSFNYSLHLNKKGEFNAPSGAGRSYFSPSLEKKLVDIKEAIHKKESAPILFVEQEMSEWKRFINFMLAGNGRSLKNCVFFADPPYSASISKHPYRVGELRWKEEEDRELFSILDNVNADGGKFILTNVFKNNGAENIPLQTWAKSYKVHHVGVDYSNCNYQRLNKGDTDEVIVYNF